MLVPRFSQAYDSVPGLSFNHAISLVNLAGERLWVDTTDDVCRFGLLPPGDPGRNVLVIDGKSSVLTNLPKPDPRQHQLRLEGKLWIPKPGGEVTASLSATASGYQDYEMRTTAREVKEHRQSLPLLAARYRPVAGSFALKSQKATVGSALDEKFTWQADGRMVGWGSMPKGAGRLPSPFWLPRDWDLVLHQRHTPLFLNQGFPLTLEEDFEIALPSGARGVTLPAVAENLEPPLRWHVEWARLDNDRVAARFKAELAQGELSEVETPALQEQVARLLSILGAAANFSESQ